MVTIVFILALAFFVVRMILALSAGGEPELFDLGASVILAVALGFAWLRSVKGYRMGQGEMVIERAGPGKVHIPYESILSAEPQSDLGSFVRSGYLSTQGLFGWAGKVNVRKPTDVKSLHAEVYGTNPTKAVTLRLQNERTIIVTPADTDGFVGALREAGVRGNEGWSGVTGTGATTGTANPGSMAKAQGKKKGPRR